ncbi:MAG: RNA-directed DNA polymerase [Deltaproteobacteria bacterium]|nr:RNA-directed DNA polymerase [Deltaproteobacteria bacterium]
MSWLIGDDLLEPFRRKRGIPIGNLTSQFFANIYLNDLDHFIKEVLKCRYYIRYVDDIAILDDSKERLWDIKGAIEEYLEKERLKLHPKKCMVSPVSIGTDMLGYRVFPAHRLLRKDNSMGFMEKMKNMSKLYQKDILHWKDINPSVQSWLGHASHADSYGLRREIFGRITFCRGL